MKNLQQLTAIYEALQPTGQELRLSIPERKGDIEDQREILGVEVTINSNTLEVPVTLAAIKAALDTYTSTREEAFNEAESLLAKLDSVLTD